MGDEICTPSEDGTGTGNSEAVVPTAGDESYRDTGQGGYELGIVFAVGCSSDSELAMIVCAPSE